MSANPTEMISVLMALRLCPDVCHHGMKDDGTPIVQHSEKTGGSQVKTAHAGGLRDYPSFRMGTGVICAGMPGDEELMNQLTVSALLVSGKTSVALVPCSGAESMVNEPPNARIRSWILDKPNLDESPPLGVSAAAAAAARSKPVPSSLTVMQR
jgi:hypothetical protein